MLAPASIGPQKRFRKLKLVLIHGRDQAYQIPDTLKGRWTNALRWGLQRIDYAHADTVPIEFVFYGDIWRADDPGQARRHYDGRDAGDESVGPLLDADRRQGVASPPTALEMAIAQDLAPGIFDTDRFGWDDLASVIESLDARLGVGKILLAWLLGDLNDYLTKAAIRERVKARLAEQLEKANDEVIVLGHSMGSVVGYDYLADGLPNVAQVRGFLTFGSPLGMPTIRRQVIGLHPGTPFPPHLEAWRNVFNRKDFATLVRRLKRYYGPTSDLEDVEAIGRPVKLTNLGVGHDPEIYLSSIGLATALKLLLDRL